MRCPALAPQLGSLPLKRLLCAAAAVRVPRRSGAGLLQARRQRRQLQQQQQQQQHQQQDTPTLAD
jgi:hypothetical protein